jgi:5-methyltetrahydrofolate--homocysteine methyltransferase
MPNYNEICNAVVNGDEAKVKELTQKLIDAGSDPLDIINKGLIAGMDVVGPRFKNGEMFVPEVLMAAKVMGSGVKIVKTVLADDEMPSNGTFVIGTVEGDLHDIGKNLVAMLVESAGFKVINLGIDLSAEAFVNAAKEHNPDILGLSALLTTTMKNMKDVIDALKEAGLKDKVKVIIGGAPITQSFADEIGADGFASDAASAAELCKKMLAE